VRIYSGRFRTSSGVCHVCSNRKRPFESLYRSFCSAAKRKFHSVGLSFEEFLAFTKIKSCYYCNKTIHWEEYSSTNNQLNPMRYYLDRKENDKGYSKENCVVCCTECNFLKRDMAHNDFLRVCINVATTFKQRIDQEVNKFYGGSCGS
jgi:hypothetical protein